MRRTLSFTLAFIFMFSMLPGMTGSAAADNDIYGVVSVSGSTAVIAPEDGYDLCTLRYTLEGETVYTDCESWTETASGYTVTLPDGAEDVTATFFCLTVWDCCLDVTWYSADATEFYLTNPAQLAGLAAIVNGIYNSEITRDMIKGDPTCIVDNVANGDSEGSYGLNLSTSTYHYGDDDFNGKTIYLCCDMNMGTEHNYMPIGGQYRMDIDDPATKLSSSFNGTFDGQGYTVTLYCERCNTDELYGDGQSVGLIGRLGVHDGDPVSLRAYCPCVRNVVVRGYISARRSVGGIVGKIGKTMYNNSPSVGVGAIIENCANYASIYGTDAKGTAGICGASWNGGIIRNCCNFGDIHSSYAGPCGGITGYNEVSIINCYNVGTVENTAAGRYAEAIGSDNGGSYILENNYYLKDSASNGGYYNPPSGCEDECIEMTAEEMRTEAFISLLNNGGRAFVYDSDNINDGYPILRCTLHSEDEVTGFTVNSIPDTEYLVGQSVSMDSFALYAKFSDGTREKVTSYTVTIGETVSEYANDHTDNAISLTEDMLDAQNQVSMTVSGTYGEQSFSYTYTLTVDTDITPTGLTITGLTHLTYTDGEYPDLTGVTATVSYESNSTGKTGSQSVTPTAVGSVTNSDGSIAYGAACLVFSYTVNGETVTAEKEIRVVQEEPTLDSGFYLLDSADDLIWYAAQVNERSQVRLSARLTANIDMSEEKTIPIGNSTSNCYAGTFDGNGYTITLGSFQSAAFGGLTSTIALFGVTKNAEIYDLTIDGTISGVSRVAAFIAQDTGYTCVINCTNNASVTASNGYAGGITAYISGPDSSYTGCTNTGAVSSATMSYGTGGIIGTVDALCSVTVSDCANSGTISVTQWGGGIVGSLQDASIITDCTNTGTISGTAYLGGIVGRVSDVSAATIANCQNSADVVGSSSSVGGIVGSGIASATYTIYACSNTGTISGNYSVGGIAGQYAPTIEYCYNTGTITASYANSNGVGGIVGTGSLSTQISYCYNVGIVSATAGTRVGALVGYAKNYVTFENCYFLSGTAATAVSSSYIATAPDASTDTYLQSADALTALNANGTSRIYCADSDGDNGGYPVHRYTLLDTAAVESITLLSQPSKLNYIEGEQLDLSGMVISAAYTDDTNEIVMNYDVSLTGALTVADTQVVISGPYQPVAFSFTISITVSEKQAQLLRVVQEPTQTIYVAGETFDSTGMTVQLVYNNGETAFVTGFTCSPSTLTADTQWVTVSYNGLEATTDITVLGCSALTQNANGAYLISNADELLLFAAMVDQRGMTDIDGSVTADIDASAISLLSIGSEDLPYSGSFDGNGHTITVSFSGSLDNVGLFGTVQNALLIDLTVSGTVSGSENIGALVGHAVNSSIERCTVAAAVSGGTIVGGLVGYAVNCTVMDCSGSANLSVTNNTLGGIVGLASDSTLFNCTNEIDISAFGKTYIGGVVGQAYGCTVSDCANAGALRCGQSSGGIIGCANYGCTVSNCSNSGSVTATGYENIGGIVGNIGSGGSAAVLELCVNS
ncbi:MAG: bacterial Ig-like domain-containing protein, partial [Oscillospiraceae bacterium]|nr:bacterial Ig-like domain-containing protein [Oscillospiraceae bacterium]